VRSIASDLTSIATDTRQPDTAVGDTAAVARSAMAFRESEVLRVAAVSPLVFGYETDGVTLPLSKGRDSLHFSIREQALGYFKDKEIGWWRYMPVDDGEPAGPTRLLRSSQVACVNHLMLARLDRQIALAVVRSVIRDAVDIEPLDGGFAAFEWIGEKADIGETGARTRGANRTNLDAVLIARRPTGKRVGLVIEWKYTETYTSASHAVSRGRTNRVDRYSKRLLDPAGPIDSRKLADLRDLFHDPFLQLTRQALLAWRLAEDDSLFDDWVHLHVIPPANRQLIGTVTARKLTGATMPDAFAGVLRNRASTDTSPLHSFCHWCLLTLVKVGGRGLRPGTPPEQVLPSLTRASNPSLPVHAHERDAALLLLAQCASERRVQRTVPGRRTRATE
jgi:hypothetical protein